MYEIVITEPGTLTAYTTGNWFDTTGRLKNTSCNTIATNYDENYSASKRNFKIVENLNPGTYYIQVDGDNYYVEGYYTLHVEFVAAVAYTISASAGSGGSIDPDGDIGVGDGATKSFNMQPDTCYSVDDVLVDGVSVGAVPTYTFTNITADHTIETSFVVSTDFDIDITAGSGGTVSPGTSTVACGTDQTFTVTADTGYRILDVLIDGVSVVDPLTVVSPFSHTFSNVLENHGLEAVFTEGDWIILTDAGADGSIYPAGPVGVKDGANQSFTIKPDPGFEVKEVWVNGISQGAVYTYDFINVTAHQEIRAEFQLKPPPAPLESCVDISQTPLDTLTRAAPPNIMFIMDDSGSMDCEFMTVETDGRYDGACYLFDDPGDNVKTSSHILATSQRDEWKSQWAGYNALYYDPLSTYEPWPNMPDADTTTPKSHPEDTKNGTDVIDLTADFTTVGSPTVIIDNGDDGFTVLGANPTTDFKPYYHDDAVFKDHHVSMLPTDERTGSPSGPQT
jgi:hypothetical protein